MFFDPIIQINTKLYREGPGCLRNILAKRHTFLTITKGKEIYILLPEKFLKVKKKETKALLGAESGKNFGREISIFEM